MDTVARLREQGVRGMLLGSIEDFTAWALEDRHEIVRVADEDGNVTIMFSDIEGSTAAQRRARRRDLAPAARGPTTSCSRAASTSTAATS